ncbi:MAG: hypothetical protein JNG83_11875 [Opitutaceae bacterium]|nr:hypothetical protein [Opitutaceae bacterium]
MSAASGRGALGLAGAWGLAEATFFFLVPDVLLSRLALQRPRLAFAACGTAVAGALLGGVTLFAFGQDGPTRAALLAAADWLPGISPALVEQARSGLAQHGLVALFTGVLAGVPYKLYAVQAAEAGIGWAGFIAVSLAARFARFAAVTAFAWFLGERVLRGLSPAGKRRVHAGGWTVFYVLYFWRMGL